MGVVPDFESVSVKNIIFYGQKPSGCSCDRFNLQQLQLPSDSLIGTNSGIGLAVASTFASAGWRTYASMRSESKKENLVKGGIIQETVP